MIKRLCIVVVVLVLLAGLAPATRAQRSVPTEVEQLSGKFSVAYQGYDSLPLLVGLNDASGLFGNDPIYLLPKAQQVIGTYDGSASSGTYQIDLPPKPAGRPFDVTSGKSPNPNLMIFDIRLMSDVASRGYMALNEDMIASTLKVSIDYVVEGGKLLVWTADDNEQFPSNYGADRKLFTADDPRMTLPAGWSLVNLDKSPFDVIREEKTDVDLTTTGAGDNVNYSSLRCAELIPTFLDRVQKVYPFTDLHKIDWANLRATLIPASKTAKTAADCQRLIRDFGNAVPDGHVDFGLPALVGDYNGGLGIRLDSTSDGKVVVVLVRDSSPASQAGMKPGAIITRWDGRPVQDALKGVTLQYANSSTPHGLLALRLSLLPFGKLGTRVEVTFQNPGQSETTANLTRVEPKPGNAIRKDRPDVKDYRLPSGIGYIRVNSFLEGGTLRDFDKAVDSLITSNAPGIIIDVRSNPGGFSQMSDAMASRFFDQGFIVGKQFASDGRLVYEMIVDPRKPIYHGPLAILVDRNTASAADLFAYTFKSSKRATIVGNTPSAGMAGTVSGGQYLLPDGAFIQVPTGGFTDANGKLAVEGEGVAPDVLVPVTVDSLLSTKDDVLEAAVASFKLQSAPVAGQ
jgi:C-terminal peptidase prc